MKNINIVYFFGFSLFFILLDFKAFAQPGDDTGGSDLEGNDPAAAMLGDLNTLVVLMLAGILYAFYVYKKKKIAKS
jgi:hypothetical protein